MTAVLYLETVGVPDRTEYQLLVNVALTSPTRRS